MAGAKSGTSHHRGQHADQRGRDAQAEERDGQRQPGGHDRAEGDEQHDRRAEQAEALGPAAALGHADRAAAERDGQPVAAGALGEVDELRAGGVGQVPHAPVELERRAGDRAIGRDADRPRAPDALHALGRGEEALHAGPRACGACAPADAFQTTVTVSPVRPGKRCASTLAARSDSEPLVAKSAWKVPFSMRGEGEDGGQRRHPAQDDAPAVAVHEGAEPAEAAVVGRRCGSRDRSCATMLRRAGRPVVGRATASRVRSRA